MANGAHQAGPYIPRDFLNSRFPSLNRPEELNPEVWFDLLIDSHSVRRRVRAVWYNGQLHGKTRNESRLTNFGGISSPLLDPENTGALVIFAFQRVEEAGTPDCRVWVCRDEKEEELAEDLIGQIEPAQTVIWSPERGRMSEPARAPITCWLGPSEIPPEWTESLPQWRRDSEEGGGAQPRHTGDWSPTPGCWHAGTASTKCSEALRKPSNYPVSGRDSRMSTSSSPAPRVYFNGARFGRGGRWSSMCARSSGKRTSPRATTFRTEWTRSPEASRISCSPTQASYRDPGFPKSKLRMLAVKTTCKDRWRQVLREADRIRVKHLLTLQEGVSVNQYRQMTESRVRLVVPEGHITKFRREIRAELITLGSFIQDVRTLGEPDTGVGRRIDQPGPALASSPRGCPAISRR